MKLFFNLPRLPREKKLKLQKRGIAFTMAMATLLSGGAKPEKKDTISSYPVTSSKVEGMPMSSTTGNSSFIETEEPANFETDEFENVVYDFTFPSEKIDPDYTGVPLVDIWPLLNGYKKVFLKDSLKYQLIAPNGKLASLSLYDEIYRDSSTDFIYLVSGDTTEVLDTNTNKATKLNYKVIDVRGGVAIVEYHKNYEKLNGAIHLKQLEKGTKIPFSSEYTEISLGYRDEIKNFVCQKRDNRKKVLCSKEGIELSKEYDSISITLYSDYFVFGDCILLEEDRLTGSFTFEDGILSSDGKEAYKFTSSSPDERQYLILCGNQFCFKSNGKYGFMTATGEMIQPAICENYGYDICDIEPSQPLFITVKFNPDGTVETYRISQDGTMSPHSCPSTDYLIQSSQKRLSDQFDSLPGTMVSAKDVKKRVLNRI